MAGCKEEKGELRLDGLEGGGDVEEEEETGLSGRHWLGEGRRKRR